jgi:ribosome-associated translation inhibitor RaiA
MYIRNIFDYFSFSRRASFSPESVTDSILEADMQIDIVARSFPLTDAMRAYVNRRLDFSLSVRDSQIKCVVVRLSDTNGPRGGNDKCCRIQVVVPGHADVVVQDIESDLYRAIDRATDRVSRTVARRLDRQRSVTRRGTTAGRVVTSELAESLH